MDPLRVRALSFNIFAGSPLPYVAGGTHGIAWWGGSRLRRQLDEVRAVDFDVAGFQELYGRTETDAYRKALEDAGMVMLTGPWRRRTGRTRGRVFTWVVLVSCAWMVAGWVGAACVGWILLSGLVDDLALAAYLSDANDSGLALAYRKDMFDRVAVVPLDLPQDGDFMNVFQPRCALVATLVHRATGTRVAIASAHLNAWGGHGHRIAQLECVTRAMKHADLAILCCDMNADCDGPEAEHLWRDGWDDGGCREPTWSSANPLTRGWMRAEDSRVDHVWIRGGHAEDAGTVSMTTSDHYAAVATACHTSVQQYLAADRKQRRVRAVQDKRNHNKPKDRMKYPPPTT